MRNRLRKIYQNTIEYYDERLNSEPNNLEVLYNKALVLFELKQYSESEKFCDKVLDLDSCHVNTLNLKGIIAGFVSSDYKTAISYFNKALDIEPQNERILKNKEFALSQLASK